MAAFTSKIFPFGFGSFQSPDPTTQSSQFMPNRTMSQLLPIVSPSFGRTKSVRRMKSVKEGFGKELPTTSAAMSEEDRNKMILLYALSGALRGKSPIESGLALKQQLKQQELQQRRDKIFQELAKDPDYADRIRLIEAGIDPRMLAGEERKIYKPELATYKNVSDKDIKIGTFIIKPGESMPLNVADPRIADDITGVTGLQEKKDIPVYTRQGAQFSTEDGIYREILYGDKQKFSGPMGELTAEAFFNKYPNATTTTAAEGYRYIPDIKTFRKFDSDLVAIEKSMFQLENYWKNVQDSNIGLERLGDQISQWFKTLAGQQDLTPEELYRALAEGRLQGLIGANRIDTVGGGVMTEKDAWRVISRLGGDVNALQNPVVVGPLLKEMYDLKVFDYNKQIKSYNNAVDTEKFKGYEKRKPISSEQVEIIFSTLPQGIPAGSEKVIIEGIELYKKDGKYYRISQNGVIQEVIMD